MANTYSVTSIGDLTDALYAHRHRLNGLYAALYGFGEHQCQTGDLMFDGITQLCRDIADESDKLFEACESISCCEKRKEQDAEETAKTRERVRVRLREILLRDEGAVYAGA